MSLPTLHTRNLTLRPLKPAHGQDLFAFFKDAESMRFMPTLPHQQPSDSVRSIATELGLGAQYWALIPRGHDLPTVPEAVIGYAGYLGGTRVPGMGYLLRREFWNRGLITEALHAALDFGFDQLKHERVELWINEHNVASRRVAEKLGFRPKGRIHQRYPHESSHHIMMVYGLRAAEWPSTRDPAKMVRPQVIGLQPVLAVDDVGESARYYRDILGFHIDFLYGDPPVHAGLAFGDWSAESVQIQFTQAPSGDGSAFAGWLYIMVEAEIDVLFQRLKDGGAQVIRAPETYPWGMREFSVRDCNGFELRYGTHAFSSGPE